MADIEFFFDPVCPWAWITSRWVEEVRRQRPMSVDWKFIALRIVNEKRNYERDFPPRYDDFHTMGWRLLRVAAALREAEGPEAIGPYYEGVSGGIHVDRRRDEFLEADAVVGVLQDLGYDPGLAAARLEEKWDTVVRAETEDGLSRTGGHVGTPIITFASGQSFFGPVINHVPRGPEALELWDTVERLANFPGFSELKRAIREKPVIER
jgi:2-hydroxychromene-2-carboxylate isomerase